MSNKFLPFVVENSTPIHIFKTLISRSKGMNRVTIASIFNLILSENITELRKIVKNLPELSLEKIYEELLIKYPGYRVNDEVLATYEGIAHFFPPKCEKYKKPLQEYSVNDAMLFFCSMIYADTLIDEYTDFNYKDIKNVGDKVLHNLKTHVLFSDDGEPINFLNENELRYFILYQGIFRKYADADTDIKHYCASLGPTKNETP